MAEREKIPYQEALNKVNVEDFISSVQGPGKTIEPFAGGGIAGLSGGIDMGPQVESMNPDSQGLQGLMKRGIKT